MASRNAAPLENINWLLAQYEDALQTPNLMLRLQRSICWRMGTPDALNIFKQGRTIAVAFFASRFTSDEQVVKH